MGNDRKRFRVELRGENCTIKAWCDVKRVMSHVAALLALDGSGDRYVTIYAPGICTGCACTREECNDSRKSKCCPDCSHGD